MHKRGGPIYHEDFSGGGKLGASVARNLYSMGWQVTINEKDPKLVADDSELWSDEFPRDKVTVRQGDFMDLKWDQLLEPHHCNGCAPECTTFCNLASNKHGRTLASNKDGRVTAHNPRGTTLEALEANSWIQRKAEQYTRMLDKDPDFFFWMENPEGFLQHLDIVKKELCGDEIKACIVPLSQCW